MELSVVWLEFLLSRAELSSKKLKVKLNRSACKGKTLARLGLMVWSTRAESGQFFLQKINIKDKH